MWEAGEERRIADAVDVDASGEVLRMLWSRCRSILALAPQRAHCVRMRVTEDVAKLNHDDLSVKPGRDDATRP